MVKVLLISLLLVVATNSEASVRSFKTDDTPTLRPISLMQQRQAMPSRPACKPILLLLRFPDGRFMLVGAVLPKTC